MTQLVVIPLLAFGVAHLCGLKGGEALGLIIVAGLPGSALSKLFTFLGRGNIALSISLSVLTTLAAIVTVPLLLQAARVGATFPTISTCRWAT